MTTKELRTAAGNLVQFHERFAPLFGRPEPREHSRVYIHGLILHDGRVDRYGQPTKIVRVVTY